MAQVKNLIKKVYFDLNYLFFIKLIYSDFNEFNSDLNEIKIFK
jgi:hypothetical protein